MKKNFIWNSIGTTLNAFTSLFFIIIVTRINGVEQAGLFTFAFSTSIIIQVLGYYSGRVFQVTETNKQINDSDYLYQHLFTSIMMIAIGVLFCLFRNYDYDKCFVILILLMFRAVESFIDSLYAILQKKDLLYKVGLSYTLKAILSVILFLIADIIFKNIIISSFMILIVQIVISLCFDYINLKKINFKLNKFNKNNVLYIFKSGFMIFMVTLFIQYLNNAPKFPIDRMLSYSDQTIYGIIAMPATLITLLAQFIIHPIINLLKMDFDNKDINSFKKRINSMCYIIITFGILAIVIGYILAVPVFKIIYGIDLSDYKIDLIIILFGAIMSAIISILSNALITIRKTRGQAFSYAITSIMTLLISNFLVKKLLIFGASLTYLFSMSILLIMFVIYYITSLKTIVKKGE